MIFHPIIILFFCLIIIWLVLNCSISSGYIVIISFVDRKKLPRSDSLASKLKDLKKSRLSISEPFSIKYTRWSDV